MQRKLETQELEILQKCIAIIKMSSLRAKVTSYDYTITWLYDPKNKDHEESICKVLQCGRYLSNYGGNIHLRSWFQDNFKLIRAEIIRMLTLAIFRPYKDLRKSCSLANKFGSVVENYLYTSKKFHCDTIIQTSLHSSVFSKNFTFAKPQPHMSPATFYRNEMTTFQ